MSRRGARRLAWAGVTMALAACGAGAADILRLEMAEEASRVSLRLEAELDAPPADVYAVITDYAALANLHRHVLESRVVRRIDPGTVDVYTRVRGCVAAVFCRSVIRVERITERPPTELLAEVLPEASDFAFGIVRWRLVPAGDGTRVEYETEVEPDFWVPKLFGRQLLQSFLRRTTEETIAQVEVLARRRHAAAAAPAGEAPLPAEAAEDRPR